MNQSTKPIPYFKNEDEERAFWDTHDITEYMTEVQESVTFTQLKPTTETISLRLPKYLLDRIRIEARRRDIPYQSFMKMKLFEILNSNPASKNSHAA